MQAVQPAACSADDRDVVRGNVDSTYSAYGQRAHTLCDCDTPTYFTRPCFLFVCDETREPSPCPRHESESQEHIPVSEASGRWAFPIPCVANKEKRAAPGTPTHGHSRRRSRDSRHARRRETAERRPGAHTISYTPHTALFTALLTRVRACGSHAAAVPVVTNKLTTNDTSTEKEESVSYFLPILSRSYE